MSEHFTPEWKAYYNAKRRCEVEHCNSYQYYGKIGVQFKFDDFAHFYAVLGPRPTPNHSVDRINTYGHYEPGNVRWATREEQDRNRRKPAPTRKRGKKVKVSSDTFPVADSLFLNYRGLHAPQMEKCK